MNPTDQVELQPLINDLNGQIAAATNATNGLAGNVLAFTPAQWNANHDLLSSSKSSQQSAHTALTQGRSDVRQIATAWICSAAHWVERAASALTGCRPAPAVASSGVARPCRGLRRFPHRP